MKKVCVGKSNVRDTRDITNIIKNYIKEDNDISKANRSYGYHGNHNSSCYYDEPFYIVDLDKVEDQFNRWVEYLPNIQPYFAVKSNPDNKIINLLAKLGCCFDCASKNELKNVLSIVHNPDKIIFANPCKVSSHLMYARDNNITMMTFDSMEELEKIYTESRTDHYNDETNIGASLIQNEDFSGFDNYKNIELYEDEIINGNTLSNKEKELFKLLINVSLADLEGELYKTLNIVAVELGLTEKDSNFRQAILRLRGKLLNSDNKN